MKILVAEDSPDFRELLEVALQAWGYQVTAVKNGTEAWEVLQGEEAPPMAVLDWMMPGLDGPEVCRRVRLLPGRESLYIILLTARREVEDIVQGLGAGADDYISKPVDMAELRARVRVGGRLVELQATLAARVRELEEAITEIRQLRGMLPMCSYCKKIRDDRDYWQGVEKFITDHSEAQITHSVCPDCYQSIIIPQLEQLRSTLE